MLFRRKKYENHKGSVPIGRPRTFFDQKQIGFEHFMGSKNPLSGRIFPRRNTSALSRAACVATGFGASTQK
jgi:hypothetical protein